MSNETNRQPRHEDPRYEDDPLDTNLPHLRDARRTTASPDYVETPFAPAGSAPFDDPVERRYKLARATQIIWLIAGILEALIGIRFILKLIAANPNAGFAQFIYGMTELFLAPFNNLTSSPAVGGAVLEIPSLIAILVYALLAWGIVRIMWILLDKPRHTPRT